MATPSPLLNNGTGPRIASVTSGLNVGHLIFVTIKAKKLWVHIDGDSGRLGFSIDGASEIVTPFAVIPANTWVEVDLDCCPPDVGGIIHGPIYISSDSIGREISARWV